MVALCLVAQGCASPEIPAMQTIRVQTPGCPMTSCELSNDRGAWHLAHAPGSIAVLVSGEPLRVSCHADDSTVGGTNAALSRPGTSGVGGAVGGVVGGTATGVALGSTALAFIPPLGVIAVLTGAGVGAIAGDSAESRRRQLRYPALVSIALACSADGDGSPQTAARRPGLGMTIRGLTLAESRGLGLGERTAVIVMAVAADGRAAASGLRSGDAIIALDAQDLGDAADLEEQVLALPPEASLALSVWRDRRVVELMLTRSSKERP
jgi:hypothetical protein